MLGGHNPTRRMTTDNVFVVSASVALSAALLHPPRLGLWPHGVDYLKKGAQQQ